MGTCTCPPLGLGFIHRPGAVRRSRARRSCRGLRGPAPPGRGEEARWGCAPAPDTGDALPAAPPRPALLSPPARGAAHLGCPGTEGFLRGGGVGVGGQRRRRAGARGGRRQVWAGALAPAYPLCPPAPVRPAWCQPQAAAASALSCGEVIRDRSRAS